MASYQTRAAHLTHEPTTPHADQKIQSHRFLRSKKEKKDAYDSQEI